jgi:DNA-binding GntR family transcriptional regulator
MVSRSRTNGSAANVLAVLESERRPPSAAERASTYLRDVIFDGVIRPGDRVDQNEVAAALDISRQPVREAASARGRRTARGAAPTRCPSGPLMPRPVRGHFELYDLPRPAAPKVARSADLLTVERLLLAVTSAAPMSTRSMRLREFYRTMNVAAGNLRLRYALRSMSRFVPGNFYARYPDAIALSRRGTRRILRAIEQHRPDQAAEATLELWRAGGELVVDDLVARGVLAAPASGRRTRRADESDA